MKTNHTPAEIKAFLEATLGCSIQEAVRKINDAATEAARKQVEENKTNR